MSVYSDFGLTDQLQRKSEDGGKINSEKDFGDKSIPYSKLRLGGSLKAGDMRSGTFDADEFLVGDAINLGTFIKQGWFLINDTWSYLSADAPTFVCTVPTDATTTYSPGMRIKIIQESTKYFLVTAVDTTTVTLYGGTDYTLTSATITEVYYSPWKAPFGFPLDPTKWTQQLVDNNAQTQATPATGTYYNLGSLSLSIPIGTWDVYWRCTAGGLRNAINSTGTYYQALSTSSSSISDQELAVAWRLDDTGTTASGLTVSNFSRKIVPLTTKTTYYLIFRNDAGIVSIDYFPTYAGSTIIKAVSAYL
jgi:hypothetical protein